jgi:hypothetical protein
VSRSGATLEARIGAGFAVPPAGRYGGALSAPASRSCVIDVDGGDRLRIEATGEAPAIGEVTRLQFISRGAKSPLAVGRSSR